jgi:sugar/nucleoside kinase (ribokinase family)
MPDCDVLLFGDYFCDIIVTGLSEVPRLGADIFGDSLEIAPGGAYILTIALHRLGVKVCWAAHLGNDLFSRFLLEEAGREGIDMSLFQQLPTPQRNLSVSFSFAHDRGFISYCDPYPSNLPWSLVESRMPRWVVNAPFDGSGESRRFVDFIHQHGGRVYTDCQYITMTLSEPGLTDLLSAIDIFAPNLSEACQLTGAPDPEAAAATLAQYCPLVVIKCGADGALARWWSSRESSLAMISSWTTIPRRRAIWRVSRKQPRLSTKPTPPITSRVTGWRRSSATILPS